MRASRDPIDFFGLLTWSGKEPPPTPPTLTGSGYDIIVRYLVPFFKAKLREMFHVTIVQVISRHVCKCRKQSKSKAKQPFRKASSTAQHSLWLSVQCTLPCPPPLLGLHKKRRCQDPTFSHAVQSVRLRLFYHPPGRSPEGLEGSTTRRQKATEKNLSLVA